MEGKLETATKLSSGTSLNDLEWPLTQISRSRYYSTSNNFKTVQNRAIFTLAQWLINRKSYTVYRMAPLSMTLNDPCSRFQGHAILWRWISQKRYEIHSVIEILIGTYTRLTQQCHFKWPWVILSDLAKFSMTWSIARSLCDSWASCHCRATTSVHLANENNVIDTKVQLITSISFLFIHSMV